MFKNLKDKLATQVNKTNQTLFSTILSPDSILAPKDSTSRSSLSTNPDDNQDASNRSRLNSGASDCSQTASFSNTYVSPSRHFMPPSDVESEFGADESDHETNSKVKKLLIIYKNKFLQLKKAYDEIEHEKDHVKNLLQQQQDTSIKRQSDLREKIKLEQKAKEQLEVMYRKEIAFRDNKIEELHQQLTKSQQSNDHVNDEEVQTLREKNTKLETLLTRCKEAMKSHQDKQAELVIERDDLLRKLDEKQNLIESIVKDHPYNQMSSTPVEAKEHDDLDINALLRDKAHLEEQLNSLRIDVQRLEHDLESERQQQNSLSSSNERFQRERGEFEEKYKDLSIRFDEQSTKLEKIINEKSSVEDSMKKLREQNQQYKETIHEDEQKLEKLNNKIELLKDDLSKSTQQHTKSFDALKTEYENLTNELHQTRDARDQIQSLYDHAVQYQTAYQDKCQELQRCEQAESNEDLARANFTKLQDDYKEAMATCVQLSQTLEQRQKEYSEQLATAMSQQQSGFDNQLRALEEDKNHLNITIDSINNKHRKEMESLQNELEETSREQLAALNSELRVAQDKITDSSKQIDHIQILFDEQKVKYDQHETELQEKSTRVTSLEQELKNLKSQSNSAEKQFNDEFDAMKEQLGTYQRRAQQLQDELNNKIQNIQTIEKQLEEKHSDITQLHNTIDNLRASIETFQSNDQQLIEENNKMIDTLKQDYQLQIVKLNEEHQQRIEELKTNFDKEKLTLNETQQEIENRHCKLQQEKQEKHSELEAQLQSIVSEKTNLIEELDRIRLQIRTDQSNVNEINDKLQEAEQQINQFQTERATYDQEIQTLKSEILSLMSVNEENTSRIDQYENEKFNFEQEIEDKTREITERDEKIQEIQATLKQTQESATKLRKALQKMKESKVNNGATDGNDSGTLLRQKIEEYEQKLKEAQSECETKIKMMAKEMNNTIEENEYNYNTQLNEITQKYHTTEKISIANAEKRVETAEQRTLFIEQEMSKLQEEIKIKQLDHHRVIVGLQSQIQKLTKALVPTSEESSQTALEDIGMENVNENSIVFQPTEIDYLKKIVLAYMTGTDRLTMAKVICAILRYDDTEKTSILEHEKVRQQSWLNPKV